MSKISSGKYAKAISDRSGMEFPYNEMVKEWNGSFVHISEFEAKQPQLEPTRYTGDPQGLRNARPDRTEPATQNLLPSNPFSLTSGSASVTVTEPNHGRSNGNTVRFRNVNGSPGGLAFYLAQKFQPQVVQAMKLYYEDELARALAEDGSASSTYITPKAYYPGA